MGPYHVIHSLYYKYFIATVDADVVVNQVHCISFGLTIPRQEIKGGVVGYPRGDPLKRVDPDSLVMGFASYSPSQILHTHWDASGYSVATLYPGAIQDFTPTFLSFTLSDDTFVPRQSS